MNKMGRKKQITKGPQEGPQASSSKSLPFTHQSRQFFFLVCLIMSIRYNFQKGGLNEMFYDYSLLDQPSTRRIAAVTLDQKVFSNDFSFSMMWYRGTKFHSYGKLVPKEIKGNEIKVDVVSVGMKIREDKIKGQVNSWGRHKSIRYFFGLNEADDSDPTCHETLTKQDMLEISAFCGNSHPRDLIWKEDSPFMNIILEKHFVKDDYLEKQSPGWLCAQKRFTHGIGKLGRLYQHHHQQYQGIRNGRADDDVQSLPDYLILVDDDTYFDMDWFNEYVAKAHKKPKNAARVEAGCLIRFAFPDHPSLNFNFPWGGNGIILNKNAIENLFLRRITLHQDDLDAISHKEYNCLNYKDSDWFLQNACQRLKENFIGESTSFVNGMTVSDLMDAHASRERYTDTNWRDLDVDTIKQQKHKPYCLHSDWATGYYINNYHISNRVADLDRKKSKNWIKHHDARIGWNLGYLEYDTGEINGQGSGTCLNYNAENCDPKKSPRPNICHYTTPEQMEKLVPDDSPNFIEGNHDDKHKSRTIANEVLLPSLQLIGAQKAALSSIVKWITGFGGFMEPKVFDGEPSYYNRQVNFFNNDARYTQGYNFYAQRWNYTFNFQHKTSSKLVQAVDATPETFFYPKKVWELYKSQNVEKELKIIFIARNPIEREFSTYYSLLKNAKNKLKEKNCEITIGSNNNIQSCELFKPDLTPLVWSPFILNYDVTGRFVSISSFDEYISKIYQMKNGKMVWHEKKYSWYALYLKDWFDYFDRNKQILILDYEELKKNPNQFLQRIARFLDNEKLLMEAQLSTELGGRSTNDGIHELSGPESVETIEILNDLFIPLNDEFYNLLSTNDMGQGPPMEQNPFPKFELY